MFLSNKKVFNSGNFDMWQIQHFPTIVFSGYFDGHQLFNEDKVLLLTRDLLPGWKHGSRIWWLWLTRHQPCRLTLQRIYFVVQKKGTQKKKKIKNSNETKQPRYFHVNVPHSVFTVQCPLSSCTGANQSCSWSVVASALCERYFFSQRPYSVERCVKKHFLGSRRVLGDK